MPPEELFEMGTGVVNERGLDKWLSVPYLVSQICSSALAKVWGRACVRSYSAPATRWQLSAWPLPSLIKASSHQTGLSAKASLCPVRRACSGEPWPLLWTPALRRTARKLHLRWKAREADFWGPGPSVEAKMLRARSSKLPALAGPQSCPWEP